MCEFFFADPVDELEIECPCCEGSGWIEGAPYGYDPRDGSVLSHVYRCECEGRPVFVACEPIHLQELLDLDAEMAAAGPESR